MLVVNLFGGPCTGKSTIAAGLFYKMKMLHYNVELVTEYAKDLTYEGRFNVLSEDQLYVLAKQNRKLKRLDGVVDVAITDSPLLLSAVYADALYRHSFYNVVSDVFDSYNNVNFRLLRNPDNEYQQFGRYQDENKAKEIDDVIKNHMLRYCSGAHTYDTVVDSDTIDIIYDIVVGRINR